MRVTGVLLYVKDVDRAVAFYAGTLGLRLEARPAPHTALVDAGGVSLYLHREPDPLPDRLAPLAIANMCGLGVIIHLTVEDVDLYATRLDAAGYPISQRPIDQSFGRRQMYLYDPDGYNLVLEAPLNIS
jgi:catechol 2,3-dioxygenase-like lactoylglutathione lyase family enzyme